MCRVCHKRPEIADERFGRCEPCAKGGRIAYRFRIGPAPGGTLTVRTGEMSPRALRDKLGAQLAAYTGTPKSMAHLEIHQIEVITAKDKLETVRVAPDLGPRAADALNALRAAAEKSDAAWAGAQQRRA